MCKAAQTCVRDSTGMCARQHRHVCKTAQACVHDWTCKAAWACAQGITGMCAGQHRHVCARLHMCKSTCVQDCMCARQHVGETAWVQDSMCARQHVCKAVWCLPHGGTSSGGHARVVPSLQAQRRGVRYKVMYEVTSPLGGLLVLAYHALEK